MYYKISILSNLSATYPYRLKHSTYLQIDRFYKNCNLVTYQCIRGTDVSNEVKLGQDPEANTDSKPHLAFQ